MGYPPPSRNFARFQNRFGPNAAGGGLIKTGNAIKAGNEAQ